ncbi:recombination-associated protein RdgC [Edwardsiella piscicida]|nr:recombination-associated protein RdgC [Edwardsiella piscicida]
MLWFKNLLIYRLNREIPLVAQEMESQLSAMAFTPAAVRICRAPAGFPLGGGSDALTHCANGQILLCARKEEKILPAPVLKQALQAKIERLEGEQHRKLKKPKKTR